MSIENLIKSKETGRAGTMITEESKVKKLNLKGGRFSYV